MTDQTYQYPGKFGDEDLDYAYDWASRLAEGETIVTVTGVAVAPLILVGEPVTDGTVTTFRANGGGTGPSKSTRVNLLATTDNVPPRKLGAKLFIPILAR